MADFTHRYPLEVMCGLMGVPTEDVERFLAWTVDLNLLAHVPLEPHMDRIDAAIAGLRDYLTSSLSCGGAPLPTTSSATSSRRSRREPCRQTS